MPTRTRIHAHADLRIHHPADMHPLQLADELLRASTAILEAYGLHVASLPDPPRRPRRRGCADPPPVPARHTWALLPDPPPDAPLAAGVAELIRRLRADGMGVSGIGTYLAMRGHRASRAQIIAVLDTAPAP